MDTKSITQYGYKNKERTQSWMVLMFQTNETQYQVMVYEDYPYVSFDKIHLTEDKQKAQDYFQKSAYELQQKFEIIKL